MGRNHPKKPKRSDQNKKPSSEQRGPIVREGTLFKVPGTQTAIVYADDMLLNQLRRDGPLIAASFDQLCSDDLMRLSLLFSQTGALIHQGLMTAKHNNDELRIACAQLLINATSSFCSAISLLRTGYVLQPGIIIRSLLEAISTTLHLKQNPKDLTAYQNHSLQSPKTIGAAKKAFPMFGHLYGHFSDNFAHIGQLHKLIAPVSKYSERNDSLEANLYFLRLSIWLLYATAELIFNDLVENPRYWKPIEKGHVFSPSDGENDWMLKFLEWNSHPTDKKK